MYYIFQFTFLPIDQAATTYLSFLHSTRSLYRDSESKHSWLTIIWVQETMANLGVVQSSSGVMAYFLAKWPRLRVFCSSYTVCHYQGGGVKTSPVIMHRSSPGYGFSSSKVFMLNSSNGYGLFGSGFRCNLCKTLLKNRSYCIYETALSFTLIMLVVFIR